jgi:hypothetical protein
MVGADADLGGLGPPQGEDDHRERPAVAIDYNVFEGTR